MHFRDYLGLLAVLAFAVGCGETDNDDAAVARVRIKNDFNNATMSYQPPWTICESSYLGASFGPIAWGETSDIRGVKPGLDFVLMIAAWDDPTCSPENTLPIASKNAEEVVDDLARTIAINMANHQGPCPPEGVAPIPQATYERILALWPAYGFLPYEQRVENLQCL